MNMFKGKSFSALLITLLAATAFTTAAYAGTGGTEFADIWTLLTDWTQGVLGRIIAGTMVLIGIVAGIARQSLMAFALGIGAGVGLYNAPSIMDNVLSATLPLIGG